MASRAWGRLARLAMTGVVRSTAARFPTARRARSATCPLPRPAPYPGDFTGPFTGDLRVQYDPSPDGDADPGEIVWGWVPFEEDATRGKDRPALVVAREGRWVLALMLTSRDHDRDARAPVGRWLDIGAGNWDSRRRPSEVRLDRVLRLDPDSIRREGAVLDRRRFDEVAAALRALHGGS